MFRKSFGREKASRPLFARRLLGIEKLYCDFSETVGKTTGSVRIHLK